MDSGYVEVHRRRDGRTYFGERYAFESVHTVVLSPDEGAVLAASDDRLVRYARSADGRLTVEREIAVGASAVAWSTALLTIEGAGRLVARDPDTLAQRATAEASAVAGAQRMVALSGGRFLVAGFDNNNVSLWQSDGDTITPIGSVSGQPGLGAPQDVVVSPDERFAYVAGFCDHGVAAIEITTTGLRWVEAEGGAAGQGDACAPVDVGERQQDDALLEHPSALALTPDGGFLYVAIKARNLLMVVYAVDGAEIQPLGFVADRPPYDDYSDEDFHLHPPDLPNPFDVEPRRYRRNARLVTLASGRVLGASRYGNALALIEGSATTEWRQRGDGGVGSIPGAYNLAFSPDEKHVYVAPRTHGSVGAFAFDSDTGSLTELPQAIVPHPDEQAGGLTNVFVTPDGLQVLAVDTTPPAIHIHDRGADGALTFVRSEPIPSCNGAPALPVDVQVTPDGRAVLVADFQDPEDGASCVLSYPRSEDGVLGTPQVVDDELVAGVESFAITADGADVYAACFYARSVAHYRRAPGSHVLTQVGGPVREDLNGAEFVVLSRGETRLWVSSPVFHKLVAFQRGADGALEHVQTLEYPELPIKGAAGLSVSPGGDRLWMASRLSETITTFGVAGDGRLSLLDTVDAGQGHVASSVGWSHQSSSLRSPTAWINGLEVTRDGRWIVTSAVASSTVASWQIQGAGEGECSATCAPGARAE